jgi:integrase
LQPYPVAHRQLLLFELPPDLGRVGRGGFPDPPDPYLAAWLEQLTGDHATRHGWSSNRRKTVRQAIRILLALQATPGAPIRASDVVRMTTIGLPVRPVLAILAQAGMLDDDRTPAIQRWFDRQVVGLPAAMASELRVWFQVLLHGSQTPPRSRPRAEVTIRTQLGWALPTLQAWARAGHQSLREISREDVLVALPPSGNPRATLGRALRSIFRVLKARKLTFTNPTVRIKTGEPESRPPLPTDLATLRERLDSPDPARAALIALLAFHGLRSRQLCELRLADLHDGRLHLGDRTILLAARCASAWPPGSTTATSAGRTPPTRTCSSTTAPPPRPTPSACTGSTSSSTARCGRSARTASSTRPTPALATCAACATCSASASRPPNATPPPSTTQP